MFSVVFVCLGNICRSPVAEGIFKQLVIKKKMEDLIHVESAGTAPFHIGERPHKKSTQVAKDFGIILDHLGQQFTAGFFNQFDLIICMDKSNYDNVMLLSKDQENEQKVFLMRQFEEGAKPISILSSKDVPDPYYGTDDGFITVHQLLETCCQHLLTWVEAEKLS